jgi:hypothetical protein
MADLEEANSLYHEALELRPPLIHVAHIHCTALPNRFKICTG